MLTTTALLWSADTCTRMFTSFRVVSRAPYAAPWEASLSTPTIRMLKPAS
ncbi:MAG: hypothetical protein JWP54_3339 [Cryobacterium sp.]|nr:hypothetical protein [Cryobacterium sp.]